MEKFGQKYVGGDFMKTVWMRVGVTVKVTDKQYEQLKEMARDNKNSTLDHTYYNEIEAPEWLLNMVDEMGKRDGESYIPPIEFENDDLEIERSGCHI